MKSFTYSKRGVNNTFLSGSISSEIFADLIRNHPNKKERQVLRGQPYGGEDYKGEKTQCPTCGPVEK
jgi:hypothetical protein